MLFTPTFEKQAAAAGLGEDEVQTIVSEIAAEPLAGDLMVGTGGARKRRFARAGAGKSGGYRTIHYYAGDDVPIFLLALIDKGRKANLTKAERNALTDMLQTIAQIYRGNVRKTR